MAGKYHLFLDGLLLALDDDGGCVIAEYAEAHGFDEAVELFREWLQGRIDDNRKARAVMERRRAIRRIV